MDTKASHVRVGRDGRRTHLRWVKVLDRRIAPNKIEVATVEALHGCLKGSSYEVCVANLDFGS